MYTPMLGGRVLRSVGILAVLRRVWGSAGGGGGARCGAVVIYCGGGRIAVRWTPHLRSSQPRGLINQPPMPRWFSDMFLRRRDGLRCAPRARMRGVMGFSLNLVVTTDKLAGKLRFEEHLRLRPRSKNPQLVCISASYDRTHRSPLAYLTHGAFSRFRNIHRQGKRPGSLIRGDAGNTKPSNHVSPVLRVARNKPSPHLASSQINPHVLSPPTTMAGEQVIWRYRTNLSFPRPR